jgi:hypothetical protein
MRKQENTRCIEPDLYATHASDFGFEDARAILLGKYAGKEMDPKLEGILREHLTR